MSNNNGVDVVRANIQIVAIKTIEVSVDGRGWLTTDQVESGLAGVNPGPAGDPAAVFVHGLLHGTDMQAAHTLASVLYDASNITLYAHGTGVSSLAAYLRTCIAYERNWQPRRRSAR